MGYADGAGNPVGSAKRVILSAGQADFLDLNGNGLVSQLGQRVEVRPVFTPVSGTCRSSVQVYEQITGSTLVYIPTPGPPDVE